MGIAKAYSAIEDYEQSNLWWEKVGGLEHFLPYTHRCQYYNDRGVDLLAQDRYSEGKEYFEKALDYIHKYNLGDWEEKFVKMNLAQAYLEMNEFHELKKILPEVETFFKEVDYKTALHFVKTLQIEMENHQVVTHLSLEEAKHLISTDLEDIDVPELQNERLKALLGRYAIANDGKRFYATYRVLDSLTSKQNDMNLRMRLSAFVATSELDDIAYVSFNHDSHMWEIKCIDGAVHVLRYRTNADTILSYSPMFVQISKCYIVNINKVERIVGKDCYVVGMSKDDEALKINRKFKKEFMNLFYDM